MELNMWVVVCNQFHSARGPWMDPATALAEAKRMTEESSSGCIYIPVLLKTEGELLEAEKTIESSQTVKYDHPGQYL